MASNVARRTLQEALFAHPARIWMVAGVYAFVAAASLYLLPGPSGAAAIWPASGLFVAALVLAPARHRPMATLALGLAHYFGGFAGHTPPLPHLAFSLVITLEAWLAATLIDALDERPLRFERLSDVGRLVLGACIVAAASAGALGAAIAAATFDDSFLAAWREWWLPDAVGILLVTPLVVRLATGAGLRAVSWRAVLEWLALHALVGVVAAYIFFGQDPRIPLSVGVLPLLIWAALRFGVEGNATASFILWAVASTATQRDLGPFRGMADSLGGRLAWAHVYVAVTAGSMLAIAAAILERHKVGAVLATTVDELRDAYTRVQAVIASAPDLLAAIDHEFRVMAFNPAWGHEFERLSGRVPSLGLDIRTPLVTRGSSWALTALGGWERALRGERFSARRGPEILGGRREMVVEFSPIRDGDGRVIGAVQILRDVTDERRRQEAEAQARRFESVGQLAGGIAHDFNNIITGILAYASLLEHSLEAGDERRVDVKEIERSATRAAELTSQLLAYARRQVVEPRVVAVNLQVRETSRLLERLIGEGIELSVDLAPDVWNVRIDPAQFEQVLVNLAINARDAMPEGGHLRVVTANATLTAMQLPQPASGPGEYVRIDVSDTGTGIPGDLLDRIFEPFFTTKAIGKGTGLGLASVFGTVQQAGGAIAVESDGEHGATFTVFLPRVLQDADATGASGDDQLVAGKGETILLVEDETAVLESIKRALERHGYRVLSATNGDDALAHMRQEAGQVRVVIADLVLPRSSGKTLIEQLRHDHPDLRAILMSGYGEAAERVPGVRFLAKPFAPSEMTAAVRELLDN